MNKLFESLQIGDITFANRIVCSPMCQYSSVDGFANDWHLVHLGSRAVGKAALVIAEASAVSPEGRITASDLGIWKDDHIGFLQRITAFLDSQGTIPGIQLAHAGRKASHHIPWKGGAALSAKEGAWETFAPSAIAFKEGEPVPKAMTNEDIQKVVSDFEAATNRAKTAGFKVIEIHAAHGYLLHEFLSPSSNQRSDEWGGSFLNRCRLLFDVVDAVRKRWPSSYPLFVRISATDWVEGGWSIEDSIQLAKHLQERGVDVIDCSTGGNVHGIKIPVGPLYQVPFAARIKKEAGIMTAAVGMITTESEAESILRSEHADMVLMARQLLRDPYFPLHAAKEAGVEIQWPVQYERAKNY
jgi:2,4-dienoyl-CoA reductase-like NADH-dependent reductase (Old Yellow Enzyme family)